MAAMTKDELLVQVEDLKAEVQRLRDSLEHKDKLLDQCIQGLVEFNKIVYRSASEQHTNNQEQTDGCTLRETPPENP